MNIKNKKLAWWEENAEGAFEGFLRFWALVVMTIQIVTRYFFNHPLVWTEEVARFLNIFAVMTTLAWAIRLHCEMKVTVVVDFLPKKLRKFIGEVMYLFGLVIIVYLFYNSIYVVIEAQKTGKIGAATEIPYWIIYLSAPFGFGLAIVRYIQQYYLKIKGFINRKKGIETEEVHTETEVEAEVREAMEQEKAAAERMESEKKEDKES
ncbi:MAG: TRAP transporter small permease [Lachnospiraceae bacterium]|nr:TRAP transporter small permease [Lachnospiraceae bacterium]